MTWRRVRHRATTAAAVVTVPVLVAVLAFVNQGFPLAKLDLDDGAVWVTATSQLKLGRYNVPVQELNAGLVSSSSGFDVEQDAGSVLLVQPEGFAAVDPAGVTLGPLVQAPNAQVSMAAGIVSVVSAVGGLYVRPIGGLEGLRVGVDAPDADLSKDGRAVVATDGTVVAVDDDGSVTKVAPGKGPTDSGTVGTGAPDALTAVGDEPVVLRGATVTTSHGEVTLDDADGLVLQQPGPASTRVLVASRTALYEVPLDGGTPVRHPTTGNGVPAAPVQVGDCAHAAWATPTGSYLRLCAGADAKVIDLQDTSAQDVLKFRVNRSMVILNDTLRGRLWSPLEDSNLRTPNWDDIKTPDEPKDDDNKSESTESVQHLTSECSSESSPPTAVADSFGVRPGRTTILPVIDNDSSADCGVLVVSAVDKLDPTFGTVSPIYDGRALQVKVLPTATGSADFTYTITDGSGSNAPSTATVHLTAHGADENAKPEQIRTGAMKVEQGGQSTYQALADFVDPDGDDLLLTNASLDASVGHVTFKQDGSVTVLADGEKLGRARVTLQVSDGTSTIEGRLDVDVRPAGSVPPQIDPVYAVAYVDRPVVVKPLESVTSSSGVPVKLASVQDVPGATITTDAQAGTFTFQSARVGTFHVPFVVTAAPQQATGFARIDVVEYPTKALPPVAVRDRAFLPAGGEVTVDPLANDSDPSGGVLVLQDVEVPAGSGLHVAVLDHHLAQIHADTTLTEAEVLTYTVSNGASTATGQIVVQPVPPRAKQPPVVENVEASVRTGGVVTIPVLDTAYDPDGDPLKLEPTLTEDVGPGKGLMFVSGDVLRYQAPSTPTTARATFSVTDGANHTGATVTVQVHAADAEHKKPPRPKDLTARVFAGSTVRIPVPLVGIDDDGDGVTLLGVASAPRQGTISQSGADWIEYQAGVGASGTDEFTYAVEDWVGQRMVATVRVGISPPPQGAATVVARDDAVTIRPGQSVEVRVLANDVDSSGSELTLAPDLAVPEGIEARAVQRRIAVQAPRKNGTWQIQYTVTNARGGRDTGVLAVTVDDKAPVLPPIARDVVVPGADTLGLTEVSVNVLEVAQNPSGPPSDLVVSVPASVADVARVDANGNVIVTLVKDAQTVPFLITNKTSPTAASYAFITVPALGFFAPTLRPNAPKLRVASGARLDIVLDEYVKVAPGGKAKVADLQGVTASHSNGDDLVASEDTLTFTSVPDYAGPASITALVTDSTGTGGTSARTAYITLSIDVYAVEDHPPAFQPSLIDVAPGEPAQSVSLPAMTISPDGTPATPRQYSYALTSAVPPGFAARIDADGNLLVAAEKTAPKGQTGTLNLRIGYGRKGTMTASIDLRVIASTRAKARVLDRQIDDGAEGQQVSVDVLEGAFNPFPESPLTVIDAQVETPDAGTAGWTASKVNVRPATGFIGTMVTRFRVRDVTGDPDRYVEGRITVVVRGKPATPVAPRIGEVRDRTVVLSWTAPDSRGTPITGYRVTASPGGATKACPTTSCTFDGLTNDVEYTFSVEAQNAVGWSDPSPASLPARPDAVPDAPAAPTVDFGDGRLDVSWTAPASAGSPITSYTVELTGGSKLVTVSEPSTSHSFTGLTNGTQYTVRVRAKNSAPDPSGWSPSTSQTPAGVPDAPGDVKANATDIEAGSILAISWSAPKANGDAIGSYEVTVSGPGGLTETVPATARTYTFKNAKTKFEYTVSVRAKNKAGWGASGTTTAATFGKPGEPFKPVATAVRGDGSVDVTWGAADDNGAPLKRYELKGSDGSTKTVPGTQTTAHFDGLKGGTTYSYSVQAVNDGGSSQWVESNPATATTPPGAATGLTLTEQRSGSFDEPTSMTIKWSAAADGGAPVRYYWTLTGGRGEPITGDTADLTVPPIDISGRADFGKVTTFTLKVVARTSIGDGPEASESKDLTWGTVPNPVTDVTLGPDDATTPTSLTVAWTPGGGGGSSNVTFETCWIVNSAKPVCWDGIKDATFTRTLAQLGDPAPGATVQVVVTPHNARGDGKPTSSDVFTMPDPPPDTGGGTP
ncbi:MAG: fibronectin type III domain-containing protein [Brevundimonas sp.]